tara:strand:+ start:919 stop:1227 length:309 start_codon:yes stop_codon:yes gene_type:complete
MVSKIDFIIKVNYQQVKKFLDYLDKKTIEYGLITEWGACLPEDAEYFIEFGEEDNDTNWIATKGFLQKSEDDVFVRLVKDGETIDMPKFEDIFELKELKGEL